MASGKIKTVAIILSEKCNLNCVYCYEHNKDYMVMDTEVAKKALLKEFSNADGYDSLEIHFHGGEPFLAFPQVKEISEWLWSQKLSKPYVVFATSNGTQLVETTKQWLQENKHRFIVGLSLDGNREMHNINRSNSYDLIDREFFLKTWPKQSVKMTISPYTVATLADGIIENTEYGFFVHANLAMGMDWSDYAIQKSFAEQLKKLADYYLEHNDMHVCSLLEMDMAMLANQTVGIVKNCGTGEHMIAYAPDGKTYPCHTFMPSINYGKPQNEKIWEIVKASDFNDARCLDCVIRNQCPTCYGINYFAFGDVAKRPEDFCKMNKIRAKAISYFYGKMLLNPEKYKNRLDLEHLPSIAKGVIAVQKAFGED